MDYLFSSETPLLDVWVEWRKLLLALESLALTGETRWLFFGAGNRVWSGRTGWSVVETHGQLVGLRLRRTSASGKLVEVHFSLHDADFV